MSNDLKWMISSDQHFPFHNAKHIELWFDVLKWFEPDVVDYLGDTSDQACFSRWTDGSSSEFIKKITTADVTEMFQFVESGERPAREFFKHTRDLLPDAELFVALGNHDIRIFDYLDKKLPELVAKATPENLWSLDSLGYDYIYYGDLPKHRFGDIHVHHGVSISKHAGESARNDVETFGVSMMRGHSHRMGSYYNTKEIRNETLRGYEIGHLTDVKSSGMSYTNVHNWQSGFAVAHIVNGFPHIQLIQIIDNTCVVDGKLFTV
jgi:hypothetical protein